MAIIPFRSYWIEDIKLLGEGGFGDVQLVHVHNYPINKSNKNRITSIYAKKILNPKSTEETNQIKRFSREVLCQSKFNHPNIVRVVMHNLNNENPWFLMELAEISLADELSKGSLSNDEKISALKMLLSAVDYIHCFKDKNGITGYVHRDIKPANILKFKNGVYKLSDFGLIRTQDPSATSKLTTINKIFVSGKYTAPEIQEAGQYSVQSDIYAIGKVIYDLQLGDKFDQIADKCTQQRPNKRYVSVKEIILEVQNILEENI
ncbi:serine/threonine protein kinase [Glaesserella parasuis]|nr:serine/threonine-protein kinase [Glaesserella parasuis]MCT8572374.1 serine/threonine protein kinase [Glaesserella parasuis]MCT8796115.1 serine/threonine protein kinase [Glaesserella parasuis]MDD2170051.1 serine/threonine protein kinase [Glaesserella parasuis]MDP0148318.1 serine/threonine-protein kinase [Glaesserella parasuis]MDP0406144.1 serine/threonine-protein kinase [Glaesserella parasuis]